MNVEHPFTIFDYFFTIIKNIFIYSFFTLLNDEKYNVCNCILLLQYISEGFQNKQIYKHKLTLKYLLFIYLKIS